MVLEKEHLILDLDKTLIHSISNNEMKSLSESEIASLSKFKTHNMDDYYTVVERTGLQPFLDYIFNRFNVSIWTAASKDYALFVIENIINIKPDRKLEWIMFSYHCDVSKKENNGIKDLNMLWDTFKLDEFSSENTIIIDDHPDVYNIQKQKCISIPAFDIENPTFTNDRVLSHLIKQFNTYSKISNYIKDINETLVELTSG